VRRGWLKIESAIDSKAKALDFINKYGFVTLFPIRGKDFPNLYQATKGNREEKFSNAWEWADQLSVEERRICYGKLIRGQVTLVSMEMLPYFYRLYRSEKSSGTPGKILAFIKENGPTSTTDLRECLGLSGRNKKNEFVKALDALQMTFAITVVSKGKPPRHIHTWDLTEKWIPKKLIRKAKSINKEAAKTKIIETLLENHVVSKAEDAKIFLGPSL